MIHLLSKLYNQKISRYGLLIVGFFLLVSLFGSFFTMDPLEYVNRPLLEPCWDHPFGTNGQGQDVLAQTVVGSQTTILIGFLGGILVILVGTLIGGFAGYYGGKVDDALSLLTNIFMIIPGLPLMVVLAAYLPPGMLSMIFVLVFTGWAWNARVIRSQVLSIRQRDFVAAAKLAGASDLEIIIQEILPNVSSLLASSLIGAIIYTIGAQVGLEFLGLGDISAVTWGTNLYWATNDAALLTGSWWTFVPTGLSIAVLGFGLTLITLGIDEINNPRVQKDGYWKAIGGDLQRGITPIHSVGEDHATD